MNSTFGKKELVANPLQFYNKYKGSASKHIPMPEFTSLVKKMTSFLEKSDNEIATQYGFTVLPTPLAVQKTLLLQEVFFIKELYYDTVLEFCSHFVEFTENLVRTKRKNVDKGCPFPDYFHRKRYYYYLNWCLDRFPNVILFPTFDPVGATDLIKMRCAPVFLVGMLFDTTYADEFELTPAEFFFHDVNHSRIIVQQDEAYIDTKKITMDQLIQEQATTLKEYYDQVEKNTKILPTNNDAIKATKKQLAAVAALKKMILFEVVHEDGFPFVKDIICERLVRPEGEDVVERMVNGKITQVTKITPSTLGYVHFKLLCGFYDRENEPLAIIVPKEMRTGVNIAKATRELLTFFGCSSIPDAIPDEKELESMAIKHSSLTPVNKCMANVSSSENKKTCPPTIQIEDEETQKIVFTNKMFNKSLNLSKIYPKATLKGGRHKSRRRSKMKHRKTRKYHKTH